MGITGACAGDPHNMYLLIFAKITSWQNQRQRVRKILDFATHAELNNFFLAIGQRLPSEVVIQRRLAQRSSTVLHEFTLVLAPPGVPLDETYGSRYRHDRPEDVWMPSACFARYDLRPQSLSLLRDISIRKARNVRPVRSRFEMSCVESFYRSFPDDLHESQTFDRFMQPLRVRRTYVERTFGHLCETCDELNEWENRVVGEEDEIEALRNVRDTEVVLNRKRLREAETELETFRAETKRIQVDLIERDKTVAELRRRVAEWTAHNV